MPTLFKVLFTIQLFCFSQALFGEVNYKVEIYDPTHHLARVTATFPVGHNELTVMLPAWRTGKYKIIDQANGIRNFSARNSKGEQLNWQRMDKASWHIENPGKQKVTVTYKLYANELGLRTRHIDYSHAYLDATAVLVYSPKLINDVHRVKLEVPDGWKSYSGMKKQAAHTFKAEDYHQLADSPIETGVNELFEFVKEDKKYQVVFWGKSNRSNQLIADDLKQMVTQSQTIWQGYPYQRYLFIIHATSGATGATEHLNSTVIQRPRESFGKRETYLGKFLRTAAHELVHTWNVKAYRPDELVPYDYQKENYSSLFWMAEGSTSYLQDHILLAAELQTVEEFLEQLAKRVHEFQHKPGRAEQSVSQSSFEKWIAQGGDFANNHSVNIYSEGFMASWLLDFEMLSESKLKVGIKNLHNDLYQQGKHQRTNGDYAITGYNTKQLQQQLKKLTGKSFEQWWLANVESPLTMNFESMLYQVGLKFSETEEKDIEVWTGFKSIDKKGFITLTQVEKNGPGWKAGLSPGDQLIAIDGYKVTQSDLELWLKQYKKGDTIGMNLFRDQKLIETKLTLDETTIEPREIELIKEATESQKDFFKAWLGIDFPTDKNNNAE